MCRRTCVLLSFLALTSAGSALAQQQTPPPQNPPKADSASEPSNQASITPETEGELQALVQQAGGDSAALIRNLEGYLARYPNTPHREEIYRGLLEAEMQLQNQKRALDYAEQMIGLQPDNTQMLYLAVTMLEKMPDDASQTKAIGYDTHLIEIIAKANPEARSPQTTLEDWQAARMKFTSNLFVLRGRLEKNLRKYDDAVKDLNEAFGILPNANAAISLGEIAEQQKNADEAVRQYAMAFVLTGQTQRENQNENQTDNQNESTMARDLLRLRMGNLWRLTHGSNAGLGDIWMAAYDKVSALAKEDAPEPVIYNKDISDPLQFSLRRVDGSGPLKLADTRGKTLVLNFWTTWCSYCRTMESLLADVRRNFAGRDDVVFLAVNRDEDETLVGPYLHTQKIDGTLVFSDGIERILKVDSIPTIVILDHAGKTTYRTQGFATDDFVSAISGAIAKSSGK
jgi:tetratricopeptide (TPR) repeat protein/thioredoxin-related protein